MIHTFSTHAAAQWRDNSVPDTADLSIRELADSTEALSDRRSPQEMREASVRLVPMALPLLSDPRPQARIAAADALYRIASSGYLSEDAIHALQLGLADTLAAVRARTAQTLAAAVPQHPDTRSTLLRLLRGDASTRVRATVASTLERTAGLDPEEIVAALLEAVDLDPEPNVRTAAILALQRVAPADDRVVAMLAQLPDRGPSQHLSSRRASFTILEQGHSLRSDGRGPYRDAVDGVMGAISGSAGLATWESLNLNTNQPDLTRPLVPKVRFLTFDLSQPVPGGGGVPLGIVGDSIGRFHSFYRFVEGEGELQILSFEHVGPVGASIETDRVELWVYAAGNQYVLQFGPWGIGVFSPRGRVTGEGTTRATITRIADRRWRVEAPAGSIGRLWNVNDIQDPRDAGLYYFSFAVEVERL